MEHKTFINETGEGTSTVLVSSYLIMTSSKFYWNTNHCCNSTYPKKLCCPKKLCYPHFCFSNIIKQYFTLRQQGLALRVAYVSILTETSISRDKRIIKRYQCFPNTYAWHKPFQRARKI